MTEGNGRVQLELCDGALAQTDRLEVKESRIPGAGREVFMRMPLAKGEMVEIF